MKNLLLVSCLEYFAPKLPQVFDKPLSELNVLCIPTAAYGEDNYDWLPPEQAPLKSQAKNFTELDLKGKNSQEVQDAFLDQDIVYVTGGNTYYLFEHVQKSGFGDALKKFIEQSGLYIGCSAGAVITCPNIDYIGDMDDPSKGNIADYKGLNLIDFYVMPHIDHPKYGPKTVPYIEALKQKGETVIGLNDDHALLIKDSYLQVL